MIGTQLWWYTARAGGIVSWALVSASVIWGLLLSTKMLRKPRPNWMLDLHRFLGGAAVVFTGIHVASILADTYVHFGLAEVLVPFIGSWHPVAVAWGIVALYLMLAVELTSLLRRRLSKRAWRMTHFLSFPLFIFSGIHGLTAGTDGSNPVFFGAVIAAFAAVAGLTVWRVLEAVRPSRPTPKRPPTSRRPAALATLPIPTGGPK